jgi:hypothetical protein
VAHLLLHNRAVLVRENNINKWICARRPAVVEQYPGRQWWKCVCTIINIVHIRPRRFLQSY